MSLAVSGSRHVARLLWTPGLVRFCAHGDPILDGNGIFIAVS